jgi:hypothetical protein
MTTLNSILALIGPAKEKYDVRIGFLILLALFECSPVSADRRDENWKRDRGACCTARLVQT